MEGTTHLDELTYQECLARLGSKRVGRLAVVIDHYPQVFPLNYRLDDNIVVFRTSLGTKLLAANHANVGFQVDDVDPDGHLGWSVLVQGMAFGMATLVTPAALALYYVVRDLWSALFSVAALKPAAPWVDLIHAQSPLYTHDMTGTGWLQLLVAAAIWILVPLAIGVVRVSRTEVKST